MTDQIRIQILDETETPTKTRPSTMECEVGAVCDVACPACHSYQCQGDYCPGPGMKTNGRAEVWLVTDCCYPDGVASCKACEHCIVNRFTCPMCGT